MPTHAMRLHEWGTRCVGGIDVWTTALFFMCGPPTFVYGLDGSWATAQVELGENQSLWSFTKKDSVKAYVGLATLLHTRIIVEGKIPDMMELCGKDFVKWQTSIAASALDLNWLVTGSHSAVRANHADRTIWQQVLESSSKEDPLTLEIFNSAWNDLRASTGRWERSTVGERLVAASWVRD